KSYWNHPYHVRVSSAMAPLPASASKLSGFSPLPASHLKLMQRDLPPDTIKIQVRGLKGELMFQELAQTSVRVSHVKERVRATSHEAVITGTPTKALPLQTYVAGGCTVHLLHSRRALNDWQTLKGVMF
ncbi:unnamed protein product, partial [Polarella glacialis]